MPKNDKTSTKQENFSPHCVLDIQTDGRKRSVTFQNTPVEFSLCSKAPGKEHRFVEWRKEVREWNPHIFRWENFHRWFYLQQTEWLDRNVLEWCLWTPQTVNYQAFSLNHDTWLRSIKRGEDASVLVWMGLQAKLYRLQGIFGDEDSSMGPEYHQEIRLGFLTMAPAHKA